MNIPQQDTRKSNFGLAVVFGLFAIAAAIGIIRSNMISTEPTSTIHTMTEVERIKETIRQKEFLRDEKAKAADEEIKRGNNTKADQMAHDVGVLITEIEKLYNDLHEASLKEGENGK